MSRGGVILFFLFFFVLSTEVSNAKSNTQSLSVLKLTPGRVPMLFSPIPDRVLLRQWTSSFTDMSKVPDDGSLLLLSTVLKLSALKPIESPNRINSPSLLWIRGHYDDGFLCSKNNSVGLKATEYVRSKAVIYQAKTLVLDFCRSERTFEEIKGSLRSRTVLFAVGDEPEVGLAPAVLSLASGYQPKDAVEVNIMFWSVLCTQHGGWSMHSSVGAGVFSNNETFVCTLSPRSCSVQCRRFDTTKTESLPIGGKRH